MIEITDIDIDITGIAAALSDENCGAQVLFTGTTRKNTDGRETVRLEYECYHPLAIKEMEKLRSDAMQRWPLQKCVIVHRIGVVEIGEASIAVGVASPHRKDAFEAAQWIMDTIKKVVPVWKKEKWTNGETEWVHPE